MFTGLNRLTSRSTTCGSSWPRFCRHRDNNRCTLTGFQCCSVFGCCKKCKHGCHLRALYFEKIVIKHLNVILVTLFFFNFEFYPWKIAFRAINVYRDHISSWKTHFLLKVFFKKQVDVIQGKEKAIILKTLSCKNLPRFSKGFVIQAEVWP